MKITREPLTPKVFSKSYVLTEKKINMLGFLTVMKVSSGIARDAVTHKVSLSGAPPVPPSGEKQH